MNTPAHSVLAMVALGKRDRPRLLWPLALGGVAPDLPMLVFYGWEKWVRGVSEREIWNERYYDDGWQQFIDAFNSLPLLVLAALLAWKLERPGWRAFFAAMALHALCDLPLHRDDAHRHFWPFSDWRFESPVSYWDPAHGGLWFAAVEALFMIAGSFWLFRAYPDRRSRVLTIALAVIYALYLGFVAVMWV